MEDKEALLDALLGKTPSPPEKGTTLFANAGMWQQNAIVGGNRGNWDLYCEGYRRCWHDDPCALNYLGCYGMDVAQTPPGGRHSDETAIRHRIGKNGVVAGAHQQIRLRLLDQKQPSQISGGPRLY